MPSCSLGSSRRVGAPLIQYEVVDYPDSTVEIAVGPPVARVERYLVGPPEEREPARWRTEVAILVADRPG